MRGFPRSKKKFSRTDSVIVSFKRRVCGVITLSADSGQGVADGHAISGGGVLFLSVFYSFFLLLLCFLVNALLFVYFGFVLIFLFFIAAFLFV